MVAPTQSVKIIGILDIFGFEIFQTNSFEQLCINYTNEMLQQHFNRNTFKLEEQLYTSEAIVFERVPFNDNQATLDLIEAKRPMGILAYLDEEIIKPKTTDQTFLTVVNTQLKANTQFMVLSTERNVFGIRHYAGDVKYDVNHFLEKNRDQLSQDLYDCVSRSRSTFIKRLFPSMDAASIQEARKSSLGKKFKQQLSDLMGRLYQTNPRYVRCIKSNHLKQPRVFEGQSCLLQLRYAGVFEAVRIRQSGFPFRYPHGVFYERYRLIADQKRVLPYPNPPNAKQLVTDLLKKIAELPNSRVAIGADLQVGLTRVLYRTGPHRVLELLRNVQLEKRVVIIQAYARGWFARKGARQLRALRAELQAATASRDITKLRAVLTKAEKIFVEDKYIWTARRTLHVIEAEMRLRAQIPALLKRDKEEAHEDIERWLADAREIGLADAQASELTARYENVKRRRDALHEAMLCVDEEALTAAIEAATDFVKYKGEVEAALMLRSKIRKIKADSAQALQTLEKPQMEAAVAEAANIGFDSPTLHQLRELLGTPPDQVGRTLFLALRRIMLVIIAACGQFLKIQLDVALGLNDVERAIKIMIEIKDLFFQVSQLVVQCCSLLHCAATCWTVSQHAALRTCSSRRTRSCLTSRSGRASRRQRSTLKASGSAATRQWLECSSGTPMGHTQRSLAWRRSPLSRWLASSSKMSSGSCATRRRSTLTLLRMRSQRS
jgi:myosin heavy subunit